MAKDYFKEPEKETGLKKTSMYLAPELLEYSRTMALATGQTMAEFFNGALKRDMERNIDIYNQIRINKKDLK